VIKSPEAENETKMMNRAEFLISVGGATAVIAGWVLFPAVGRAQKDRESATIEAHPRLAPDFNLRVTNDGGELIWQVERGKPVVVGHLNDQGSTVVANMDGRTTIQDLARTIHRGSDPAKLNQTEASVALFLATLAQAGLLAEPFYVNVHEAEVVG